MRGPSFLAADWAGLHFIIQWTALAEWMKVGINCVGFNVPTPGDAWCSSVCIKHAPYAAVRLFDLSTFEFFVVILGFCVLSAERLIRRKIW